ncbi:MAG: hypothetical protein JWQ48_2343 [Conexibacter sp.]|jgi:hypothetical protein|nr:hypothetical protein [Conexibacter sp.]
MSAPAIALDPSGPGWRALAPGRTFAPAFLDLRERIFVRIDDYYDRDHLTRAGDWMLALQPDAPEYLVVAALTHDLERSVPGGPRLEMDRVGWDDIDYNTAHTHRSAEIVPAWLREQGVEEALAAAVAQPIREHEFGGSPDGDLMQACDSISFLETNAGLVASWARREMCSKAKAREKLDWMYERIRLVRARTIARPVYERSVERFEAELRAS